MRVKHILGKCTVWVVLGMFLVTSCAIIMASDIDRKWFGRSKVGKGGITGYYKPKRNYISVIELEITNYGDSLKLDYNTDEYILNTIKLRGSMNLYDGSIYKPSMSIKLKPTKSPPKYPTIIEPLGRLYIKLKGFTGDYKLIDNIIVKFESGKKVVVLERIGIRIKQKKEISFEQFKSKIVNAKIGMTKQQLIGDGRGFKLFNRHVNEFGTYETYEVQEITPSKGLSSSNHGTLFYFENGILTGWTEY